VPPTRPDLPVAFNHEYAHFAWAFARESAGIPTKLITQYPDRVHGRNLGVSYAEGGAECSRIHECIAIPAATPTLIERVEPNWAIEHTIEDAAQACSLSPGPS
jgi:hypothetical protein